MLKHILPILPEHRCYVEPFAGGLAVLLAKPRAKVEAVNDRNAELVAFYRYLKYHREALMAELEDYLHSRSNFETLLTSPGVTDLQRAARWYLLKVCSFSGYSDHFGRARTGFSGFDRDRHLSLIKKVARRLKRVYIENRDFEEVCDFFDAPDTLHYFDPPYVAPDAGAAYDAFTAEDMARVEALARRLKGRWIISCDDSPACRQIFAAHPKVRIPIKYSSGTNTSARTTSYELLVHSPGITAATETKAA